MDNWRDLSALHGLLRTAYEKVPAEERRARFANVLQQELGFTPAQAQLYTSTVLRKDEEGSADWVRTNGLHVTGSWIRGEQQGNVGSWLSTMKETWKFSLDLTYEHKIERYESAISMGPFFQSSYSQPDVSVEQGIWAPPDTLIDEIELFVMSTNGGGRPVTLKWTDNENCDYRACFIDGERFSRE
jgi:hypothetical protein